MQGTPAARLPKAVLHDHLDGGLRVQTLVDLAAETDYRGLPTASPDELSAAMWQADSGSLVSYLAAFKHTVGVMQTAPAIERVAYESAIDHRAAGVVYAEIRFGPALLTQRDLSQEDAIEAALAGFDRAASETGIEVATIISALRDDPDSESVARAAVQFADQGVVGFDLAGPEAGFPASDHVAAIDIARDAGLGITLHAGEGAGVESIANALQSGAQRIGHGVRIIEDCRVVDGAVADVGKLAQRVLDEQIPLEVAVSSNLHTGIAAVVDHHPFGMLYRAGFNVSINTDNRLMSNIDMIDEFALVTAAFDLNLDDLARITLRAVEAGFGSETRRTELMRLVAEEYAAATAAP
ncbi:MAG: adenosine deaminase [Acidimicrobiia bacterium]|nr:adenosine deaminase [Acidimicrobiia bacterium]